MGEYADMMIEGMHCHECGEFMNGHSAFMGLCKNCKKIEGALRRKTALDSYESARQAAAMKSWELVQHSESHYKLTCRDWTIEIYPGNRRVQKSRGRPPFLNLPDVWDLNDVVSAAIAQESRP